MLAKIRFFQLTEAPSGVFRGGWRHHH